MAAHLFPPPPPGAWRWRCEVGLAVPALLHLLVAPTRSCVLQTPGRMRHAGAGGRLQSALPSRC